MKHSNNNESRHQNADELLKEALTLWRKDGFYDDDNEYSQFYNIAKDPIVKLFMIALAHQTNIIKDDIFRFKENLLEEFTEKIIPYYLIKPIPAFSIIQTAKEESIENECLTSQETQFVLGKEKVKGKDAGKENESFQFIPLFKTKIINAKISSVQKKDPNKYCVTLSFNEPLHDLSGVSFYFTSKKFTDLIISTGGKNLPLIKPNDYEKLPFIKWFDAENMLFDQSMVYGTRESWLDIFAVNDIQYFIVDKYNPQKISFGSDKEIEMIFEINSSDPNFNLDEDDVKINCVPVVNVEKQSVTLSGDEPIKKIATEKDPLGVSDAEEDKSGSLNQKQFLNLLASLQSDYDRNDFTIRHFGMERFNKNELLLQINSILNKYTSDYYAFMHDDELKDGEKIKNLTLALKEVFNEIKKQGNPMYGIYLVLNQNDALVELRKSIEVSYLLTDGSRANGININSAISTPIAFDPNATHLLMETIGGKDLEMNFEKKKNIAQYYFLTKDRLVTKSDIRLFCFKELLVSFKINKESVDKIDICNEFENSPSGRVRYILVEIHLRQVDRISYKDDFVRIENQLKKMIEVRSTNLFPIQVKVI
jgi:hypothetical protein